MFCVTDLPLSPSPVHHALYLLPYKFAGILPAMQVCGLRFFGLRFVVWFGLWFVFCVSSLQFCGSAFCLKHYSLALAQPHPPPLLHNSSRSHHKSTPPLESRMQFQLCLKLLNTDIFLIYFAVFLCI